MRDVKRSDHDVRWGMVLRSVNVREMVLERWSESVQRYFNTQSGDKTKQERRVDEDQDCVAL